MYYAGFYKMDLKPADIIISYTNNVVLYEVR